MKPTIRIMLAAATLAVLVTVPPSASAADYREYLFRGTVVDTDEKPIADVKLTIKHRKNLRTLKTESYAKALEYFERARALTEDEQSAAALDELITALQAQLESIADES